MIERKINSKTKGIPNRDEKKVIMALVGDFQILSLRMST